MAGSISGMKAAFFDRAAIEKKIPPAKRRAMSKFGAFVRTRAKTSIKSRKGSSKPGEVPHSKTGILKRFIFFGYDPANESVVIGPARIRSDSTSPEALEHGGVSSFVSRGQRKTARYESRPYMLPAFLTETRKVSEEFKGILTR